MNDLRNDQYVDATLSITDKKGQPAQVDGIPVWTVSDDTLATIEAQPDGMTARLTPIGPVGQVRVIVQADADLGEGVEPLVGEGLVDIAGGKANVVSLAFATPQDQ